MISFNQVPANLRIPFLFAEFNNAGAFQGDSLQPSKVLMIGPRLSSGTKTALTKSLVTSAEQGSTYFGKGSLLAEMIAKFLKINKSSELYCIPLDDSGSGVAAAGSLALSGSPTVAGTLKVYISEKLVSVAVTNGQSLSAIATALATAIQADASLLVSAVVDGTVNSQVNITAKNKGTIGNDIDVRLNYYDGDELPAGLSVAITPMASGATNPDVAAAFAVLDDTQYLHWVSAFRDAANVAALESELSTRFGPITQNDGYCHYGARGTLSGLNAIGDARNSQFTVIHACWGPTHPASQAAAILGAVALSAMNDPALPLQNIEVDGILPCSESEKLDLLERNTLLFHGISSNKVVGTKVVLERVITTYKKNPAGADDISYLNLERLLTLSYLRYDWRNYWLSKYPRHKLGKDGQQYGAGQPIMTPNTGYAEAVAWFKRKISQGLVEGLDQFKADLRVEINSQNPDRLDFLLSPDVINQLIVVGTQFKFLV
jgi:phage tail sheath gpL-like